MSQQGFWLTLSGSHSAYRQSVGDLNSRMKFDRRPALRISAVQPERPLEKHKNREELQSAKQHGSGQDQFAEGGKLGVIGMRTDDSKSGADIVQGGRDRAGTVNQFL